MQLDPFSRTRCVDIDECSLEENVARCQGISIICFQVWIFEIYLKYQFVKEYRIFIH